MTISPSPAPALTALLSLVLLLPPGAAAQVPGSIGDTPAPAAEELVTVRALADRDAVHPGERFFLAVVFTISPGWHIYWKNPGSAGLATSVDVKAPAGFRAGSVRFTRPTFFDEPEGRTFGYEREAVLFVPVRAPRELSDGEVTFEVSASWLACKGLCLMGSGTSTLSVRTSGGTAAAAPDDAEGPRAGSSVIERHARRLPRPFDALDGTSVEFDGTRLVMSGPAGEHPSAALFEIERPGVTYAERRAVVSHEKFLIAVDVEVAPHNALGQEMALEGLIALGTSLDDPSYEFRVPLDAEGRMHRVAPGAAAPDFTLVDLDGKTHTLADYRGRVLVLEWTNPRCTFVEGSYQAGVVRQTIERMAAMGEGVVYLAVNSTARGPQGPLAREEVIAQSRDFLRRHEIDITVLIDHDGSVGRRYDARRTPQVFVIDGEGVLRYHGAYTDDPRNEKQNAVNYVLHALEQIRAGRAVSPEYVRPWGCSVKYNVPGGTG